MQTCDSHASSARRTVIHAGPDDKIYPSAKVLVVLQALAAEAARNAAAGAIRASATKSPMTLVSLNEIIDQYKAAAARSSTPWIAYRAGLQFHVSSYGMYGFAILSSTNFRRTIRFALQYRELGTPLTVITFAERAGVAIWRIVPADSPRVDAALYRFLIEMQFGIHTSLQRDVVGAGFAARELHVTYAPQADPAAYAAAFGCPVLFKQPSNEFIFDAAWLDRKPELGNEASFSELLKLCDERLANLQVRVGLLGKVRALLLMNLMRPPSLSAAADHLHMSARSLRRKLQAAKVTFRTLLTELRTRLAVQYLRDTDLSVEDIAVAVGYSDEANFRRAYWRWTGKTPVQFREQFRALSR